MSDVEYDESDPSEPRICDCGTILQGGHWCATCRQSIWEIRR